MKFIDSILNRITMYRVVLYYLIALLVVAGIYGFFHVMPYTPVAIAYSAGVLIFSAFLTNLIFSWAWKSVPGSASIFITALILALIVTPVSPGDVSGTLLLVMLGVWAIAGKYLIAVKGKHLFNPAAFAVVLSGFLAGQYASWWVAGNLALLPLVLIGGLLIVRKIQRFDLVIAFTLTALATTVLTSGGGPTHAVYSTIIHSALLFLALVMLTEPATMPPTRSMRIVYGIIVGIWFAPAMHIGSFYFTPELALLLGNVFAFVVSPKGRLALTLRERREIGRGTYEFIFKPDWRLPFTAGQYLEWTLPGGLGSDSRGNRRYFTIASAPEEQNIRIGVKMATPASSFKKKLMTLKPGDMISAAQLSGDFTLPEKTDKKLAFIAGGIGVTPFRSMVGHMLMKKEKRDAVMLYSNRTVEDIAYYDIFERARTELGMKTLYALTDDPNQYEHTYNGMIDAALIAREIPDYRDRLFYISGPRGMVTSFEKTLSELGVPLTHIHTDFFPGFV